MPIIIETKELLQRFAKYIERLIDLFKRYGVIGPDAVRNLRKAARDPQFLAEWKGIWKEIADRDGGTLGLTTFMAILGAVFGSVGIAGFGGAIGVPLFLLFGAIGYLFGLDVDHAQLFRKLMRALRQLMTNTAKADSATH